MKEEEGFTLIEVLIAVSILFTVSTVLFTSFSNKYSTGVQVKQRSVSFQLAQKTKTIIRKRANNLLLNEFKNLNTTNSKPWNISGLDIDKNEFSNFDFNLYDIEVDISDGSNSTIKEIKITTDYDKANYRYILEDKVSFRTYNPLTGAIKVTIPPESKVILVETGESYSNKSTSNKKIVFNNLIVNQKETKYHLKFSGLKQNKRILVKEIALKPLSRQDIKTKYINSYKNGDHYETEPYDFNTNHLSPSQINSNLVALGVSNSTSNGSVIGNGTRNFELYFPQKINYQLTANNGEGELKDYTGNTIISVADFPSNNSNVSKSGSLDLGKGEFSLVEKNSLFSYNLDVKRDNSKPYIRLNKTYGIANNNLELKINAKDKLSGIKSLEYIITQGVPISSPSFSAPDFSETRDNNRANWNTNFSKTITINQKGINFLHLRTKDYNGNVKKKIEGPFIIK